MTSTCSVIIKTHQSEKYLPKCVQSLMNQTRLPDQVVIVDSASQDLSYLEPFQCRERFHVHIVEEDVGFCRGNNMGYQFVPFDATYVLILNPDAFVTPSVLQDLTEFMDRPENSRVGIATGVLLGYDIEKDTPTGLIDSTGIFRNWYGSWFDRDQRFLSSALDKDCLERVPAICGAFMFCRKKALEEILINGKEIFDNRFYMYKEDVDLSLRMRKRGWDLVLNPRVEVYHCRGWSPERKMVPRKNRLLSARNDIRIDQKNASPYFFLSWIKYFSVKILDV